MTRTIASMEAKAEEARRAEYLGRMHEAIDEAMGALEDLQSIGEHFMAEVKLDSALRAFKVQLAHRCAPPPDVA